MSEPKKCLFCKTPMAGRRSKEHIFPQWLQKYLDLKKESIYHTIYSANGDNGQIRKHTFDKHISGLICSVCNSGWLSNMEGESKNILIPLLDGTFNGNINQTDCKVIARWFYKTALVLHSVAIQEKFIPLKHFDALYRGEIPLGVIIAISPIDVKSDEDIYWIQNGGWPGSATGISNNTIRDYFRKSYKITMCAGKLAWRVTFFSQENIPGINFFEYRTDCVRYIYPCKKEGINWVSSVVLDDLREFDMGLIYAEKPNFDNYFVKENTATGQQ